ncbi:MAG: RNA-binding S4 domain-containing protein [Bacteroidia bacterium]|nr:RNA-binding S4 domain-containing protein [Bacteroidia bacterium]
MDELVRIDKWLWAVRLFKTRTLATEECKKGRVTIDGMAVKPSRFPKIGEVIKVRKSPVTYSYKVVDLIGKRIGAKLVALYVLDITPPEELHILEVRKQMGFFERDKGAGRPTKKDRRDLERLQEYDD